MVTMSASALLVCTAAAEEEGGVLLLVSCVLLLGWTAGVRRRGVPACEYARVCIVCACVQMYVRMPVCVRACTYFTHFCSVSKGG